VAIPKDPTQEERLILDELAGRQTEIDLARVAIPVLKKPGMTSRKFFDLLEQLFMNNQIVIKVRRRL
jgi:hypothetical protein